MNNLAIAQPWLLLLLPLPILVWWLVPPYRVPRGGLHVPFIERLAAVTGVTPGQGASIARSSFLRWLVLLFCWACMVLALARPQVVEPPISKDIPMRDMLLAVDLSGSMETADFTNAQGKTVDRLSAVKEVLDDFLKQRKGDRVGLILFGSSAFVQAPFTEDLDVVRQLLDEAQVRMAGPQTAFGDALGLAINVFDRSTNKDRVLIALTDGNDTSSQVPPEKAAQIAHDKGIVVHTVAVGDPRAAGEDALDETTLKNVASATGGLYSHAADRGQLESIYKQLNTIEARKVQSISHRPRRDVYWWPVAAGLLVAMGYFAVGLALKGVLLPPSVKAHHSAQPVRLASLAPFGLLAGIQAFHFIRPEWLWLFVPIAYLWWCLQRLSDEQRAWRGLIAPHLLALLWRGKSTGSRVGPMQWVLLCWSIAVIAIAGPTWKHAPSPFADDTAAMVVVIKVSPSMETEDVLPSRLGRATLKLHDLLKARGNARTALVAYAGSAHLVMPPTTDGGIINNFASALSPKIMPVEGDDPAAALKLADQTLQQAGGGSIVWITDGVDPEQAQALGKWRSQSSTKVQVWAPLLTGSGAGEAGAELAALKKNTAPVNPGFVPLAADESDVSSLAAAARFAPTQAGGTDTRWAESGYWLIPLLALLMLAFFRAGWLVPLRRVGV